MLPELIHAIKVGILTYVRLVEGCHYQGPHEFSITMPDYISQSRQLSERRKIHLREIMRYCDQAEQEQVSSKSLVRRIINYINELHSAWQALRKRPSRLQTAIFSAISCYEPTYIIRFTHHAVFNELTTEEPTRLISMATISQQQLGEQLQRVLSMVDQLTQQIELQRRQLVEMHRRLAEKDQQVDEIKKEDRLLKSRIAGLQVALISQQARGIASPTVGDGSSIGDCLDAVDSDGEEPLQFPVSLEHAGSASAQYGR